MGVRLNEMSSEDLWTLYEETSAVLGRKIKVEKARLEERLRKLNSGLASAEYQHRPYPKVHPKYRKRDNVKETWSGRGKQARWLAAKLRTGKRLDNFLIHRTTS